MKAQSQGVAAAPMKRADLETMSDEELVDLVAEHRREALELLYERYSGAVYSLAMQMLKDPGAAEEVAQDTFFNVWRRATSYKSDRGKVTAWLFSIGHHRIIDELRRRRRDQSQVAQDIETIQQHPEDESADPTAYADQRMRKRYIKDALDALRPEQREVVMLAYYGGLTHTEIAAKLDQPLGTVKTRMRLALKKLREMMGPQAREWADGL